jgi:protein-tyrosine phosphatase
MNLDWIKAPGLQLAIVPRPRGGDWLLDDLRRLKAAGIDVLVSLLTQAEAVELGLSVEAQGCKEVGIQFLLFPIEDRSVPSSAAAFSKFMEQADSKLKKHNAMGIHCRAGIGRSSLFAACLLAQHGYEPGAAFEAITKARGRSVPDTDEQRRWVERWFESSSLAGRSRDSDWTSRSRTPS